MKIYAAASGLVSAVVYSNFDRNMGGNNLPPANYIQIKHPDNTYAYYYHIRKNSSTVSVGDNVVAGQVIALAGSSGNSSDAHLHFEPGQYVNNSWVKKTRGTEPIIPPQHYGKARRRMWVMTAKFMISVYSRSWQPEEIWLIFLQVFKENYRTLNFGYHEPQIGVFIQLRSKAGEPYTLEIRRPDNSLFATTSGTIQSKTQYGWYYWYWNFNINPPVYGTWYTRILKNNVELKRQNFNVALFTMYCPRFKPMAGKTFRRKNFIQRDTLRVNKYGATLPVTYTLLNPPSNVTLVNDSIVTIGTNWNQASTSYYFKVEARLGNNTSGMRDTMYYHLVDTTHNPSAIQNINSEVPDKFSLGQNYPNPFNPVTNINFSIPKSGMVKLVIYDILGKQISVPVNENLRAGNYKVDFNASALASGVYFYRLESDGFTDIKKMMLVK